jgi:hypothetical protein
MATWRSSQVAIVLRINLPLKKNSLGRGIVEAEKTPITREKLPANQVIIIKHSPWKGSTPWCKTRP